MNDFSLCVRSDVSVSRQKRIIQRVFFAVQYAVRLSCMSFPEKRFEKNFHNVHYLLELRVLLERRQWRLNDTYVVITLPDFSFTTSGKI